MNHEPPRPMSPPDADAPGPQDRPRAPEDRRQSPERRAVVRMQRPRRTQMDRRAPRRWLSGLAEV